MWTADRVPLRWMVPPRGFFAKFSQQKDESRNSRENLFLS